MSELISRAFREHILEATYEDEVICLCRAALGIKGDEEAASHILANHLTDPDDAREYIASILSPAEAEEWNAKCSRLAKF